MTVAASPASQSLPYWLKAVLALLALITPTVGAVIYVHGLRTDVAAIKKHTASADARHAELLEEIQSVEARLATPTSALQSPPNPPRIATGTNVDGHAVVLGLVAGQSACGVNVRADDEYAASHELECGTMVRVLNFATGESAVFRILEKAGSSESWQAIKLALSPAAAEKIGINGRGAIRYTVESIPSAGAS